MLFDILQEVELPGIAKKLLSQRLRRADSRSGTTEHEQAWTTAELHRGLEILLHEVSRSTTIMFLVDGLDEFEGDLAELVGFLYRLSRSPVKVCVSSRPWPALLDATRSPSLPLGESTYGDIAQSIS